MWFTDPVWTHFEADLRHSSHGFVHITLTGGRAGGLGPLLSVLTQILERPRQSPSPSIESLWSVAVGFGGRLGDELPNISDVVCCGSLPEKHLCVC